VGELDLAPFLVGELVPFLVGDGVVGAAVEVGRRVVGCAVVPGLRVGALVGGMASHTPTILGWRLTILYLQPGSSTAVFTQRVEVPLAKALPQQVSLLLKSLHFLRCVGAREGDSVGVLVGDRVGFCVGRAVGDLVGRVVRMEMHLLLNHSHRSAFARQPALIVKSVQCRSEGACVGCLVGSCGPAVGRLVGGTGAEVGGLGARVVGVLVGRWVVGRRDVGGLLEVGELPVMQPVTAPTHVQSGRLRHANRCVISSQGLVVTVGEGVLADAPRAATMAVK
jgi:hypothetical protein